MKKHLTSLSLLASVSLSLAVPAGATLLAFDQFITGPSGYTTGNIYNQTPSTGSLGFTGAWGNTNNANTTHIQAEATGLTHSLAVNPNADGNLFIRPQSNNDGRRVTRAFNAATLTAIEDTSTLFYSGLFRTAENPAINAGPVWFGIGTNTNANQNPANGVYFTHNGASGFSIWNNGSVESLSLTPAVNTTYLFVVGIDFAANSVSYSVYADGDTLGSPAATGSFTTTITTANLTHLLAGHQSNNSGYSGESATPRFDEFMLGTTMDAVVIPEPRTYAAIFGLLALGVILMRRRQRS
ncbi:MAG: PEP-CTERM sorting domain-containing protein [Opitutales bacterium]|nr:PEP-CTERM sorting domain-containing protein [Opitutales bacterium]